MSGNKPEHLKKLEAEEKELEEIIYGKGEGEPTNEEDLATAGEEVPVEEVVGATEEVVHATEETAEVVEDPTDPDAKPKRVQWKKLFQELEVRYKNYRAEYDNKVFQLRHQLTSQSTLVGELQEKVDILSQRLAEVNTPSIDILSRFSQEDRDILGESVIESMAQVTQEAVDQKVQPLQQELEQRRRADLQQQQRMAEYQQNESRREFADRLGNLVPNYTEIDMDPGFMQYLDEPDPVNGNTRFHWFKQAQSTGNVNAVAGYFQDYENIIRQPEQFLENKITPVASGGQGSVPQTAGAGEPEVIPYSEVDAFHNAVVSGQFNGTEAERQALDIKYDRAFSEGRIDPNR